MRVPKGIHDSPEVGGEVNITKPARASSFRSHHSIYCVLRSLDKRGVLRPEEINALLPRLMLFPPPPRLMLFPPPLRLIRLCRSEVVVSVP